MNGKDVNGNVRVTSARHSITNTIKAKTLKLIIRISEDMLFYNLFKNVEMAFGHILDCI